MSAMLGFSMADSSWLMTEIRNLTPTIRDPEFERNDDAGTALI